ncbi:SMP-30/gluconolactonase/LRE family protein [Oscillatoria sp. FACHB-1407]|uniref:SMP-30/gluconolactonase/LRE family protein n=1 Tax=Oscillatoria sp. FACHB-1407 TaxID=2692847 RepID=UPI0016841D5F|nr:SMP-30/gluconolactonase/LRE family protein [Oscillatoria sp. FACHB-1407]MBD2461528.1 SMP-30/gluconolactonase/LRE family protein [Oscillatoria sp. FACHB-1407]
MNAVIQSTSSQAIATPRVILEARARLGESPLWDNTHQLLYWVDIYNYRVHQFNPATHENRSFDVGDVVGPIALAGDHRLIIAQRDRLAFLHTKTGELTPLFSLEADKPENRFNDGRCDAQGRFWFGSMHPEKPEGILYRLDPDNSLHIMETGLTIPNGMGWSLDEKRLYLTDSPRQTIYVYDFDAATGEMSDRRTLIDLTAESFYPDGLAIDAEGCLWSAMWDGWCVIRFDPDGREMTRISLPVPCPTSCTFGDSDLSTLYITTASVGLSQQQIDRSVCSGDLFCVSTNVRGLPALPFKADEASHQKRQHKI